MSSSFNLMKGGKLIGGGADKKIVLGFKPKYVLIVNITDAISFQKSDLMASAKALKSALAPTAIADAAVAAGAAPTKAEFDAVVALANDLKAKMNAGFGYGDYVVLNADGFTVKAAAAVAAKELHYVAFEAKND
jgi:hypothetical protein